MHYAGPFWITIGPTCRPTIVKAYACLLVSLSVKAVHIEVVCDLMTAVFLTCLRTFVAQQGKPTLIWNDHGATVVRASHELKESFDFLKEQMTQKAVSEFCTTQYIFNGSLFPNMPHILGGSGRPLCRV